MWPRSARHTGMPRWRQLLTRTCSAPSAPRVTITGSSPMYEVKKSPGSADLALVAEKQPAALEDALLLGRVNLRVPERLAAHPGAVVSDQLREVQCHVPSSAVRIDQ